MKKVSLLGALALSFLFGQNARAIQTVWNNTSTNFNSPSSWNNGDPTGNVAAFASAIVMQPNVTANISIVGLYFNNVVNYDVTSIGSFALTLTGDATSPGAETMNSDATAIAATNTSGINTIDLAINPNSNSGNGSTIFQSPGGTLVINGKITSGQNLSFAGGGTFQLNGANTTFTSSIDGAGATIIVGNNAAFGSGPVAINAPVTFQSGGGVGHAVFNTVTLGADMTISGSNGFSIVGTVTQSGGNRTVTVANTSGGASFQGGNVNLNESGASGRQLTINIVTGSSFIMFSNVFDGGVGPGSLKYSGGGFLQIENPSFYSGGTEFAGPGGTVFVDGDGRLGTGNVSLTGANISFTLDSGTTNDYIANSAAFSLLSSDHIHLNFNGTDLVAALIIDGVAQAPGVYNSSNTPEFDGNGSITVVPEAATWVNLSLGGILLLSLAQIKRRIS